MHHSISGWEHLYSMSDPQQRHAFQASDIQEALPVDYGRVINHLSASSLAGRSTLWPRAELVRADSPSYFKPDSHLYRETLRRDRRNGKEYEYVHSCGCWIEQALCALELFKASSSTEEQGRLLHILEKSLLSSKEILAMRSSYFYTIVQKGPAMARQLADLVESKVEAKNSQVQSENYATVFQELSAKYVVEAAKSIAKAETETHSSNSTAGSKGAKGGNSK